MPGLPAALLKKLKASLLDSRAFDSGPMLKSVFADQRIKPWINQIPGAYDKRGRVDLFVSYFLDRRNRAGQSVLVLFLQALHDQEVEQDQLYDRLDDLAVEVAGALDSDLPPLARNNLRRAVAVRAGQPLPADLGGYALAAVDPDPHAQVASLPSGLAAGAFAEQLESLKSKAGADWLPVDFLERGLRAAGAVGRVEHRGTKIGTAFLIAPDLVLTNDHVVREIPALAQGGVRFNVGLQDEDQWRYFAELVAHSATEALDFALVRLTAPAGGAPVTLSAEAAYPAQPANILQFPGLTGGLMQVALRYNAIVHVDDTRLYYVTDTEAGSSGSPVFDDRWRVIALHRAGIVDDARRPVKNANQGVPLAAIEPLIRSYL
jgi:hypothetical protein